MDGHRFDVELYSSPAHALTSPPLNNTPASEVACPPVILGRSKDARESGEYVRYERARQSSCNIFVRFDVEISPPAHRLTSSPPNNATAGGVACPSSATDGIVSMMIVLGAGRIERGGDLMEGDVLLFDYVRK